MRAECELYHEKWDLLLLATLTVVRCTIQRFIVDGLGCRRIPPGPFIVSDKGFGKVFTKGIDVGDGNR